MPDIYHFENAGNIFLDSCYLSIKVSPLKALMYCFHYVVCGVPFSKPSELSLAFDTRIVSRRHRPIKTTGNDYLSDIFKDS